MEILKYISKSLLVLLVLFFNTLIGLGNTPFLNKLDNFCPERKSVPLYGGCAEPLSQTIYYENLPQYIYASLATGGNCSNNYVYQWQWSADNVFFHDIPSTNAPNLYFTNDMYIVNHQSPGTTIYVQRKTICGAEVQYTNSVSITYVNVALVYARLEITYSDSVYEYDDYGVNTFYNKVVEGYVRFYSDDACTIPYNAAATINYEVKLCSHSETLSTITDDCSVPERFKGIVYPGENESWLDNMLGWEYYEMVFNGDTGQWELSLKETDDYELISADNCIIKPPIYPPHSPGFCASN